MICIFFPPVYFDFFLSNYTGFFLFGFYFILIIFLCFYTFYFDSLHQETCTVKTDGFQFRQIALTREDLYHLFFFVEKRRSNIKQVERQGR